MPLRVGGVSTDNQDRLIHHIVDLVEDARIKARALGALEDRLKRQQAWLDANEVETDIYSERLGIYWELLIRRKRWNDDLADMAREADGLVKKANKETARLMDETYPGVCQGSAFLWGLIREHAPFRALFAHDAKEARAMAVDRVIHA